MYINVLYFLWFLIPAVLGFFALEAWLKERRKANMITRSHFFKKQAIFSLLCAVAAVILNLTLLALLKDNLLKGQFHLEIAQAILFPAILAISSFFAKPNEPPETVYDRVKKTGLGATTEIHDKNRRR